MNAKDIIKGLRKTIKVGEAYTEGSSVFIPYTDNAQFEVSRALKNLGFKPWRPNPNVLVYKKLSPCIVTSDYIQILAKELIPWESVATALGVELDLDFKLSPLGALAVDTVPAKAKSLLKTNDLKHSKGYVFKEVTTPGAATLRRMAPTNTSVPKPKSPLLRKFGISQTTLDSLERCNEHTNRTVMILTMRQIWRDMNKNKFGGAMKEPAFGVIRNQGFSMRLRGRWNYTKRLLEMAPRTFNADADTFLDTFLHEMCHQATHEISKDLDKSEGGHGPTWRNWMLKVGLTPSRYDSKTIEHYLNDEEKKVLEYANKNRLRADAIHPGLQCGVCFLQDSVIKECIILEITPSASGTKYMFIAGDMKPYKVEVRDNTKLPFVYLPRYKFNVPGIKLEIRKATKEDRE